MRAAKKRVNTLDKQLTKRMDAMDWAVEELLPRFEAVLERLTIAEAEIKSLREQVAYMAQTAVMTDAMPGTFGVLRHR